MKRLLFVALVACGPKTTPANPPPHGTLPGAPPDAAVATTATPDAAPAAPKPLHHDLPRLAERSVALYQAVVATFRAAGADCPAATKKLNELRAEYADVTTANAKVLHDGRGKDLKAALAKHDDKLDAAAKEIVGSQTMSKCATDRAFTRAFDDLVGAPP